MNIKRVVNKILEGADVRKTLAEGISDNTFYDLESWWVNMSDDFASGFGDEEIESEVSLLDDGSILFYCEVDENVFTPEMFKDLVKAYGVVVGKDINVEKDSYTGGVKVTFLDMTPEEFIKKVF